jgi:preprotein translocase subunit SecE
MWRGSTMSYNPADWIRDGRQYITEVQAEYKKITWPPQKEALAGTIAVVVIVAVMTTVLAIADFLLSRVVGLILQ